MKFYLSSYKLGDRVGELTQLINGLPKRAVYIPNALDFASDLERRQKSEDGDLSELSVLGLGIERVDLRDYFGKKDELKEKLSACGLIYVRGGNVFVLRQAMKLSGFDDILKEISSRNDLVYGGYSAGACVLAPSLRGAELVDDISVFPYEANDRVIWEGLGLISYAILPHFRSDHPESAAMEKVLEFYISSKIPFVALKDGEVLIF
ncbi:MAG: Type 1 glutamine amidotransferase-like domain-containing protein [Patescibacteria group bacterium]